MLGTNFWNFYARVYDTISLLSPYRGMMRDIVREARLRHGFKVLDAGCGTGNVSRQIEIEGCGASIVAVDAAESMLRRARAKCRTAVLGQSNLDQPLPFDDASFDAVVCSNVLYSLPRPLWTLAEFSRVLRPGGRVVVTNPCAGFRMDQLLLAHVRSGSGVTHWMRFLALIPALILVTLLNLLVLRQVDRRSFNFFNPDELRSLFSQAGFASIEIQPTYATQDWLIAAVKP